MKNYTNGISIIINVFIATILAGLAGMMHGAISYVFFSLSVMAMGMAIIVLYLIGKEIEKQYKTKIA